MCVFVWSFLSFFYNSTRVCQNSLYFLSRSLGRSYMSADDDDDDRATTTTTREDGDGELVVVLERRQLVHVESWFFKIRRSVKIKVSRLFSLSYVLFFFAGILDARLHLAPPLSLLAR